MVEIITSIFSNRELASGVWLLILLGFSLRQSSIRRALGGVAQALFQIKLVAVFSTLAFWLLICVFVLWQIGWWNSDQLKLTIFWYIFSGTVLSIKSIQNKGDTNFFKGIVTDQFKVVIVLEFLVVFYSFAFWKEMIFLPFITIMVTSRAFIEAKAEYAAVKKILDGILSLVVVGLIIHFVREVMSAQNTLINLSTLRELTTPILYTLWALPFCYLWWCFACWETAGKQLDCKTYHSEDLRSYAKKMLLRSLFLRPVLLKRAVRQFNLLPAKTQQDVRDIIAEVRAYEAGRIAPAVVEATSGWSPYAAEKFLAAEGYETNDFHDSGFDGEWFAESQITYFKDAGLFETMIYRIKGKKGVVKTLQIKGSFTINPVPNVGLAQMSGICMSLLNSATNNKKIPRKILDGFRDLQDAHEAYKCHYIALKFTQYEKTNFLDVEFTCTPLEK